MFISALCVILSISTRMTLCMPLPVRSRSRLHADVIDFMFEER
jgi:hypothetical protein